MGIAICGKIVLNCRLDNKSDCNPYILLGIPPGKFCCSSQSISSTCSSSRLVHELQLSSFLPFQLWMANCSSFSQPHEPTSLVIRRLPKMDHQISSSSEQKMHRAVFGRLLTLAPVGSPSKIASHAANVARSFWPWCQIECHHHSYLPALFAWLRCISWGVGRLRLLGVLARLIEHHN